MQFLKAGSKPSKSLKGAKPTEAHVSKTRMPMGDNYGTGIKAKLGRMRSGLGMQELSKKKMGTPPKSVV